MKVLREVQMKTDRLEVGDRIKVQFVNEMHYATAIKREEDGMLFLLDTCLDEARPMNKAGGANGGYEESDMRKYLMAKASELPREILKKMVVFEDGDYLRLLSIKEACGLDAEFNKTDGQIPWMKDRRHRICTRKGDEYEWYWLRDVVSATRFAYVSLNGCASHGGASSFIGVRPAFIIKNH